MSRPIGDRPVPAPPIPPSRVGLGLEPPAPYLMSATEHWNNRELLRIIKNGVKMTGVPAWELSASDREIWAIIALLYYLPDLSPAQDQQMTANSGLGPPPQHIP